MIRVKIVVKGPDDGIWTKLQKLGLAGKDFSQHTIANDREEGDVVNKITFVPRRIDIGVLSDVWDAFGERLLELTPTT